MKDKEIPINLFSSSLDLQIKTLKTQTCKWNNGFRNQINIKIMNQPIKE